MSEPADLTCRRHRWTSAVRKSDPVTLVWHDTCARCGSVKDEAKSKKGRQSRNYGNRAELEAARRYGGTRVGHHGGPVDIRGTEWQAQMKTHRRKPPLEWTKAFAAMGTSDQLPRLLLRFVQPGNVGPVDFWVVPGPAWLAWYGKDGPDE